MKKEYSVRYWNLNDFKPVSKFKEFTSKEECDKFLKWCDERDIAYDVIESDVIDFNICWF